MALINGLILTHLNAQTTYIAVLEASQEVPPNNSTANGYGRVVLSAAQDTIDVDLGWNALSSLALAAHIHGPAGPGTNADVLFSMGAIPTTTNVANLVRSFTITSDQVAQLQAGLFYLNVHSTQFPDGELRGQLVSCASNIVVLNTNDAGPGSLRQAIAEICPGGTIQFAPSLAGQTITLTSGTLQIERDVTIQGLGADQLTVARSASVRDFRVCNILNGAVVRMTGLTITDGRLAMGAGGGIACFDSELTLENCVIARNLAIQGGGILNSGGGVTLRNCVVSENLASGQSCIGGGIANVAISQNAVVELNQTLVVSNRTIDVTSQFASGGGGVSSGAASNRTAVVFVIESQLVGNEARGSGTSSFSGIGGAIFNSFFDFNSTNVIVLDQSTLNGNRAANGGGLATVSVGPVLELVLMDNSILQYNSASSTNTQDGLGGGVLNAGSFLIATNVTFSGNSASGDPEMGGGFGGAIAGVGIATTVMALANCTVASNTAPVGGALANLGASVAPEGYFKNTIIAGNIATVGLTPNCFNDGGFLVSEGHNVEDGEQCGFTNATDIVTTNALLGPLQDNGGPTWTHALLPGSPAIDAGDATDAPLFDQRGVPRPQGAAVDIGAFELVQARPPVFTACPTNTTVPAEAAQCSALVSFTVMADGLPLPEVSCRTDSTAVTSPQRFSAGLHRITCTASNAAGTATCEFTVTVLDTAAPVITCPSNIVQSIDPGQATANVTWAPPLVTDGCTATAVAECRPMSGSAFAAGTTPVVCSATDAAGNTAACSFSVTLTVTALGPRDLKQSVLDDVIALRAGVRSKHDKDKLDEVIERLRKSLASDLWRDAAHLQAKGGEKVFHEEKEAVHKLEELIKNKKSSLPDATLQDLADRLVKVDRALAALAIAEAEAAGADSKMIEHATREFTKANREAGEGKLESAIEHYRNAWKEVVRKNPK